MSNTIGYKRLAQTTALQSCRNQSCWKHFLVRCLGVVILLGGFAPPACAQNHRTVILTGDPAPGTASGVDFSDFAAPVLNGAGQTAFRGFLTGTSVNNSNFTGIWSEGEGSGLSLVARTGNPAPGTASGVVFNGLNDPVLNNAGRTAFRGRLTGTGVVFSNFFGIWSEGGGSGLSLVARTGNQAPGTASGVNFSEFARLPISAGLPVLNGAGEVAFVGSLTGTGVDFINNEGIWSEGGGSGLSLVAREGNQAPGTASGVNFFGFKSPVLNLAGQTAFRGRLIGTGVDNSNDFGIWSEGGGSGLALVAREGNPSPGTTSGVYFSHFRAPVLNGAGHTAFFGSLTGTGVDSSNDFGIWSEGGGSGLALVARTGNQAPGTASGVVLNGFGDPVLNNTGQTAFVGTLTGTGVDSSNDFGIWSEGGGSGLALVARTGNQAPGTTSGVNFSGLFGNPVLNGSGQTAFIGALTGTGVNTSNNSGIWAEDSSGHLTLIAREGNLLDVDDGPGVDLRTIRALIFSGGTGNEDGRRSGFNDLGQLAFRARFTDGTEGIFVSNLVAVPEPSAILLALLLGLFACKRACHAAKLGG